MKDTIALPFFRTLRSTAVLFYVQVENLAGIHKSNLGHRFLDNLKTFSLSKTPTTIVVPTGHNNTLVNTTPT